MVDDVFRSYRNHDTVAREGSEQTSRGGIGDLLAELARLTGQGDPYGDGGRDGESSKLDWAEDDTPPEQRQQGEDHYVALWRPKSSAVPRERSKQNKPPSTRHFSRPVGEMRAAETDETHGAYSFYDALPSPRWRLVIVIAVLGLAGLGVVSALSRRVRGGSIADAPTPHGCREWAQKDRPELWRCPTEQFEPNVHGQRWLERKIRLTLASRQSGAAENGADLSQPERPSARRPDCARGCRSCRPSGAYGTICAAAGTSSGTGTAFLGTEEDPHGHHPLRRVRANRYLGRGCRPQRDERQGTRAKAQYRSGALA